ncbi:DUF1573 domain-containing protein [candidate division WWE3 bacterium]|nr:DUF1573 domain-containing protein [candidate division WWE3 bacterium]
MDKTSKIFLSAVFLFSALVVVFGLLLLTGSSSPRANAGGKLEVLGSTSHDWGDIDIYGGKVEKTFTVKNGGDKDLEVSEFKTSCMCTTVQVISKEERSPVFGMHSTSRWKMVIKPGEGADVKVVFDPLFHGPQATGPITRLASFVTSDASNPFVEFALSGVVVGK